ncbi:hypothetical protein CVFO_0910 [Isorropodon fossajaponicum endosymbiont JTNG4]|uniref:hypothetical protein n=1 Tax=Isorropodon fossajaponicum symbiont TaxID=883811 RepID=UPI001915268A|nr:hypothetical protein [Isorropodon fossajaponicum symbiont]BBB24074.1 hypothetical protein CVFO_0910 [Isorropodon fossajaponicum endosymbiont JTNG4]
MVINGDFESGNQAFQTDYQILTQARGHDTLAIVDTPPNWGLGDTFGLGSSGKFLMVDDSTLGEAKAFWQQEIELGANQQYQFDYWVNANRKVETQLYIDGEKAGAVYSAQAGGGMASRKCWLCE